MQRSISYKRPLAPIAYIVLFVLYSSMSSIYTFLPPMLAVLFVLFNKALEKNDTFMLLLVIFCLVVFEANHGYSLFTTVIYFYIVYKFIMPKLIQNFSCNSCIKVSYLLLAYVGYYLFLGLIANIFLLPTPNVSYYIIYYIVMEFFIVSLL